MARTGAWAIAAALAGAMLAGAVFAGAAFAWAAFALAGAALPGPAPAAGTAPEPAGPAAAERIRQWNRQAVEHYERGELDRALALFREAARAGDASALYNYAVIRLRDESDEPPLAEALDALAASAEAGFAPAQFMLGTLLEDGHLLPQSVERAQHWFRRAALQGHPEAALSLATAHYLGRGAALDAAEAARWYALAAQAGDVGAQYLLASMYEAGYGVARDLEQAIEWYAAAARQGDPAAAAKARELAEALAGERGRR